MLTSLISRSLNLSRTLVAVAVAGGLALAPQAIGQIVVKIDGSSTVYPITQAVAEEFQSAHPNINVTVGVSGTGGGFKKFLRDEIDICNASRPILAKEMVEAKEKGIEYIELPVAFDALTVVVNPKNTFVDKLTVAELKTLWEPDAQGKITGWRQVRAGFPDKPVTLFGAGSDSGTFDYFTEAIVGKAKSSRGDYTASEDDNTLVQGVHKDPNALGYFGYAYYAENEGKLRAVPIVNAAGEAVEPSKETVMNGSYNPLSRPVYIYVNKKSLEKESVQKFVRYYLTHAAKIVDEVKYIPLPSSAYEQGLSRLEARKTGTAFGGHSQAGLHVDELFSRTLTDTPPAEKTDQK